MRRLAFDDWFYITCFIGSLIFLYFGMTMGGE